MSPTDTIAREHPLNEVEAWQRCARLWDENDSRRRDNDTPLLSAGLRDQCLRLSSAWLPRKRWSLPSTTHRQRPDLAQTNTPHTTHRG